MQLFSTLCTTIKLTNRKNFQCVHLVNNRQKATQREFSRRLVQAQREAV